MAPLNEWQVGEVLYRVGDCILIDPQADWTHYVNERFHQYVVEAISGPNKRVDNQKPWIGRIVDLVQQKKGVFAKIQYYWRPEGTFLYFNDRGLHEKLLFYEPTNDDSLLSVEFFKGKCEVKHIDEIDNFDEWVAQENHYYYDLEYNSSTLSFTTPAKFVKSGDTAQKPHVVELFAGAGGLSEGFRQAGISVTAAVELNHDAAETHRNFLKDTTVYEEDVAKFHKRICVLNNIKFKRSWSLLLDQDEFKGTKSKGETKKKSTKAAVEEDSGEESETFEIEEILDCRATKRGCREYYIKWRGYDEKDNLWIPSSNIHAKELIHEFHEKRRSEKGKSKKGRKSGSKESQSILKREQKTHSKLVQNGFARATRSAARMIDAMHADSPENEGKIMDLTVDNSSSDDSADESAVDDRVTIQVKMESSEDDNNTNTKEDPIFLDVTGGGEEHKEESNGDKSGSPNGDKSGSPNGDKSGSPNGANRTADDDGDDSDVSDDDYSDVEEKRRRKRRRMNSASASKKTVYKPDSESEEEEYEVEEILKRRKVRGDIEYFIKWKNYDETHNSWEPADNVSNCREIMDDFLAKNPMHNLSTKDAVVEKLLDIRVTEDGAIEALVKWKGFESDYDEWIHVNNLPTKLTESAIKKAREELPGPGNVKLLIGGPPCKGFSHANGTRDDNNPLKDPQNHLVLAYLDIVDVLRPDYCVFENVIGFLTLGRALFVRQVFYSFIKMGYQVALHTVDSACFGTPQSRKRIILFATKKGLPMPAAPEATHEPQNRIDQIPPEFFPTLVYPDPDKLKKGKLQKYVTVKDAIGDLKKLKNGEQVDRTAYRCAPFSEYQKEMRRKVKSDIVDMHVCVKASDYFTRLIMGTIREGDIDVKGKIDTKFDMKNQVGRDGKPRVKALDDCKRLKWDDTFLTVVTVMSVKRATIVHPHQDRICSVRELARAQGFPDWCIFSGGWRSAYVQIGNAVPVQLGRALGIQILKAINRGIANNNNATTEEVDNDNDEDASNSDSNLD